MAKFFSFLLFSLAFPLAGGADENGKLVYSGVNCQSSIFSSIQKVCQLVDKTGASCTITADRWVP